MIAVVDYGAGNLFSVGNALDRLGLAYRVTVDPDALDAASGIILPGVGAFPDAMALLRRSGMAGAILRNAGNKPLLGICLGMQMLFERGYEFKETAGLGLLPGEVRPLAPDGLKVPHVGWNRLDLRQSHPLLAGLPDDPYVYFVHSYAVRTDRNILATAEYGGPVAAAVGTGRVMGTQFHPEKSGRVGLRILANFGGLCS